MSPLEVRSGQCLYGAIGNVNMNDGTVVQISRREILRAESEQPVGRLRVPSFKHAGRKLKQNVDEQQRGHDNECRVPHDALLTGGQW